MCHSFSCADKIAGLVWILKKANLAHCANTHSETCATGSSASEVKGETWRDRKCTEWWTFLEKLVVDISTYKNKRKTKHCSLLEYVLIKWTLHRSLYLHIPVAPGLCPCPWCCSLCTGTPPHLSAPPTRSWAWRCLSAARTRTAPCGFGIAGSVCSADLAGNRSCARRGNPPPSAMWQPEVRGQRWSLEWTRSPGRPADLGLRRYDQRARSL